MSDTELHEELENPLRAIIVVNSPEAPEGEMEERLLDNIQSFDDMNSFFDNFDETIAIPNEGHIKYEVGSDGLVVIVVDSRELQNKALKFMDDYVKDESKTESKDEEDEESEEEEAQPAKKSRK